MNFRKIRQFKKNAKALSPVIATIILIAVTVAVSVVVAAWMGALTIGFMGNSEQASITNVVLSDVTIGATNYQNATVTVQNTGSATVSISSAYIDANTAQILNPHLVSSVAITKGTSATFVISVSGQTFASSASYTIKLMTAKGNTITNSAAFSS